MHQYLRRHLTTLLLVLAALLTVQCGDKDGKTANIKFTVNPDRPIVIDADFTLPGDEILPGPYFRFDVVVENTNVSESADDLEEKSIVIIAFVGKVIDSGGNSIADFAFDAGEIGKLSFFELAPGDKGQLSVDFSTIFIVSGLNTDDDETSFNYRVEIEPKGWFGTYGNAVDRFQGSFSFSTQ